ncbi:Hypothetical protein D9617_2g057500 [Elsinoe fawcettii]|nr:Hypothetical protein D9617_2g057500 [Elsinoe fawcettii]
MPLFYAGRQSSPTTSIRPFPIDRPDPDHNQQPSSRPTVNTFTIPKPNSSPLPDHNHPDHPTTSHRSNHTTPPTMFPSVQSKSSPNDKPIPQRECLPTSDFPARVVRRKGEAKVRTRKHRISCLDTAIVRAGPMKRERSPSRPADPQARSSPAGM